MYSLTQIELPPIELNQFRDVEFAHGVLNLLCFLRSTENSVTEGILRLRFASAGQRGAHFLSGDQWFRFRKLERSRGRFRILILIAGIWLVSVLFFYAFADVYDGNWSYWLVAATIFGVVGWLGSAWKSAQIRQLCTYPFAIPEPLSVAIASAGGKSNSAWGIAAEKGSGAALDLVAGNVVGAIGGPLVERAVGAHFRGIEEARQSYVSLRGRQAAVEHFYRVHSDLCSGLDPAALRL